MEILPLILFLSSITSSLANSCKSTSCDGYTAPQVRFPFRLVNRQPVRCGYPGFDLYCNSLNQTMIDFPQSGTFVVDHIDYTSQSLLINDPYSCLPARILDFNSSGTRFRGAYPRNYVFVNCSSDYVDYTATQYVRIFCLSGPNYTVLATGSRLAPPPPRTCRRIASVSVPLKWTLTQWSSMELREDLELVWSEPDCLSCENEGGICGYKGESGPQIACFRPSKGLPRSAKYGIIIGVGIPGIVCIMGLACYACGLIRAYNIRRRLNPDIPSIVLDQRPIIRSSIGLDRPTIESYPMTVLGESRRLPKEESSDVMCTICLSEYKAKERLRSIPECNHYFHADCIDEWLKLNGSCPLCRNSPESSVGTPCFSISVAASSTTSSTSLERH